MHPHPQIMFELARQRREDLFEAASRSAVLARRDEVGRLARLLRLLRPAPAAAPAKSRLDRPCGHAAQS
jgi:hypothetical protein